LKQAWFRLAGKSWKRAEEEGINRRIAFHSGNCPRAGQQRYMGIGQRCPEFREGGGQHQEIAEMIGFDDQYTPWRGERMKWTTA
jgi:hypothetical protein